MARDILRSHPGPFAPPAEPGSSPPTPESFEPKAHEHSPRVLVPAAFRKFQQSVGPIPELLKIAAVG